MMRMHKKIRNQLYDYVRAELPESARTAIENHLKSCKRCSEELNSVRQALAILDVNVKHPSERRSDLYWQQFAQKVERRIKLESGDDAETSIFGQLLDALVVHRKPFGVGFASALALVLLAFGVWSLWLKNPVGEISLSGQTAERTSSAESTNVQKVTLETQAQDYLEQSKVLLIGLMNTDTKLLGGSGPILQREKEISRRLVDESAGLTAKLNDPSQRQLRELISDLQLILVQIANLGVKHDLPGVEIIKGGIEHNGILFKINLEQIQRTEKSTARSGQTVKRTT